MKKMHTVCKIQFGSHLYGTNTEKSDLDYKGVFFPSIQDVLLGRIPKTSASSPVTSGKNLPNQEDAEFYSVHRFLSLAAQGQTVAIDMLFAPENMILESSPAWQRIVDNRDKFLSRSMKAFIGYARGQAAKYSLKGERLNKLDAFYKIVNAHASRTRGDGRMDEIWDLLPRNAERISPQGVREIQIAGKWFGETTCVGNVEFAVRKCIERYGNRAQSAARAEGTDWKALSHAVRVSKELLEILENQHVIFPLQEKDLILDIKLGRVPLEKVQDILDHDLELVENLMATSTLPDRVDHEWCDKFLMDLMIDHLGDEIVRIIK